MDCLGLIPQDVAVWGIRHTNPPHRRGGTVQELAVGRPGASSTRDTRSGRCVGRARRDPAIVLRTWLVQLREVRCWCRRRGTVRGSIGGLGRDLCRISGIHERGLEHVSVRRPRLARHCLQQPSGRELFHAARLPRVDRLRGSAHPPGKGGFAYSELIHMPLDDVVKLAHTSALYVRPVYRLDPVPGLGSSRVGMPCMYRHGPSTYPPFRHLRKA
jgi:hypothetical protein